MGHCITVRALLLRSIWTALALLLMLSLASCAPDRQINAVEAMPGGSSETPAPQDFVKMINGMGIKKMWLKGFKSTSDWNAICAHVTQVAVANKYEVMATPEVPNIERFGLTKEQVYKTWLSPRGEFCLGVLNLKLIREKGGSLEGSADYILFCGGGRF